MIIAVLVTLFLAPLVMAQEMEEKTPKKYAPGEILVKFKTGVSKAEIDSMNRFYGVSVIKHIDAINVYRLKIPGTNTVPEMVEWYSADPRCSYAEPNYIGEGGDFVPNDSSFPQQWHLDNTGQTGGTVDADIDAVEGWQITRGSSAVVVAVLDTGIDSDHPEFQGRIIPGFDFVNEDSDPEADHPHGAQVSGILAANADNGFAVAGVDHRAKILPVKILNSQNSGTTADLVQGLLFAAAQGAHVVNMSLINYPLTSALNDALQFARDAGAILIACAGNGGIGNADVSGPGASPLTISVGATDHNDARASFSGTGQALDVVAPGLGIRTVLFNSSQDQTSNFSGCSAATPVVSGIVSLLLSLDLSLAHEDVYTILTQTAEDMVGPPSEDTPGRDDFFGFGRVNMHAALLKVAVSRSLCSLLGNDPTPSLLDQDIFTFAGTAGDQVTVRVQQAPTGVYSGERVTLVLSDAIDGAFFFRIDNSVLPNEITATLPATGAYKIIVAEQPILVPGDRFRGDYCLTLGASGGASQTLEPTVWVE
jgi:thermitase